MINLLLRPTLVMIMQMVAPGSVSHASLSLFHLHFYIAVCHPLQPRFHGTLLQFEPLVLLRFYIQSGEMDLVMKGCLRGCGKGRKPLFTLLLTSGIFPFRHPVDNFFST